jgi:hypothetical protein
MDTVNFQIWQIIRDGSRWILQNCFKLFKPGSTSPNQQVSYTNSQYLLNQAILGL